MPEHDRQPGTASTSTEPAAAQAQIRAPASALLALQRTAGNAAVNALLQRRRRIARRPAIESDYLSLAELRKEISIVQTPGHWGYSRIWGNVYTPAKVEVSFPSSGSTDVNELSEATVGQTELEAATAGYAAKAALGYEHPELVWHKSSLEGIEKLSYKRKNLSDTAIKMVADAMLANITARGKRPGLSYEKTQVAIGNMFLHVFGQAIITTIFGRAAADLTGDIHERDQSALIFGGKLSAKDERFAIDNYCDLINNLHGQRWGEELSELLDVDDDTVWNPVSMALYANALQDRIAADMGWKMKSFTAADPVMIQFSHLLNEVAHGTLPPGAEEVIAARAREASAKAAAEAKKAAAKKAPAAQKP